MRFKFATYSWLVTIYLLLASCANISSPTGGETDKTAPRIVRTNMKDSLLNFSAEKLEFEFDEFVQLKDVQNQLVISPLLKDKPKVTSHKRKVTVYLPDSLLKKNTTYTINFGNAIQDIHEGNPLQNLHYTFSTGSFLDTLSLEGKIIDAKTGLADTTSFVCLYEANNADTEFVKAKPLYISKVNNGIFSITNLPQKAYRIFALKETNGNLRYDSIADAMAFYDQDIFPEEKKKITLFLFKEEGQLIDTTKKTSTASPLRPQATKNALITYIVNADTLNKTKRTFDLNDTLKIKVDRTWKRCELSKIKLYQDSILDATAKIELDTVSNIIKISTDWMEDMAYTLKLSKAFIADEDGKEAAEGSFKFKTKRSSDYGTIKIHQAINKQQILFLYKQSLLVAKTVQQDTMVTFTRLAPGDYRLEILHDDNENGKWDTGKFSEKKQPEIIERLEQQIVLKANWENKIDLTKPASEAKR